jgi:hypothetical protein
MSQEREIVTYIISQKTQVRNVVMRPKNEEGRRKTERSTNYISTSFTEYYKTQSPTKCRHQETMILIKKIEEYQNN